jgi:hypothetical protein
LDVHMRIASWDSGNGVWVGTVTSVTALDDLTDVDAPAPGDGQVLTWVNGNTAWEAKDAAAGASALDDLTDVSAGAPNTGDTIVWNGTSMAWEAAAPGVGALGLDDLSDVVITNAAANHTLKYNGSSWINSTEPTHALDDLSDVVITNAAANHVLTYNGSAWINQTGGGGGGTAHPQYNWKAYSPMNGIFPITEVSANCVAVKVRAIHTGTGSVSVNVIKNYRGSASDLLSSDLASNSAAWVSSTVTGNTVTLTAGDELDLEILNTTGYVEYLAVAIDIQETL